METLSKQDLEQIQSLRHHQGLMKHLRIEYVRACTALVDITDADHFRTVQGKAQTLRQLLKTIDPESVD